MLVLFLAFGCANEWNALDADGDGWTVAAGDCWDENAVHGGLESSEIHPEAPDVPYDGVDADCAGDDDFDHDGDGYVTSIWADPVTEGIPSTLPGGDCWDDRDEIEQEFGALPGFSQLAAADVHPGAAETWYDGIDADCDGGDDFDQDADGYASSFHRDGASTLGDDCFDAKGDAFENPAARAPADVHPAAFDTCYDATDADCDGASDWDCDGDGFLVDADCDDLDPNERPGGSEIWYDGIDQDCDGNDADKDYDGFLALDYTGGVKAPGIEEGDCWDDPDDPHDPLNGFPAVAAAGVNPATVVDTFYDGIDANCDEHNDFDADDDLHDTDAYPDAFGAVGDDCDDDNDAVRPGVLETCGTPYDDDCDGDDNDPGAAGCIERYYDGDGDLHGALGAATECACDLSPWTGLDELDCDDTEPTVYEGATEIIGDGIDEDCNTEEICYVDVDGDSFRPDDVTTISTDEDCADAGEATDAMLSGDCDDTLDTVNPGEAEICNNGIDDDCVPSTDSCALVGTRDIDTVAVGSFLGSSSDAFGYAIATGELNHDGITDVAISANAASTVYGFYGPLSTLDVLDDSADFQIESSEFGFGESLAASADVDGDGWNDVVVGNPFADTTSTNAGGAYVFFGLVSGAYTDAAVDANVIFEGAGNDDQLGVSLATGDWSGDGTVDLAIGANSQDTGDTRAGALWVLFGPLSGGDTLADDVDAQRYGEDVDDHATRSLAGGDVNGDGVDDIAVGVPNSNSGATDAGGVYVVFGPLTGESSFSTADYALYGVTASGLAGTAVSIGDFEGTGDADVVVGAPVAEVAYVLTYADLSSAADLSGASGRVTGTGGLVGTAVGSAGDFDNDGRADLFVGAPGTEQLAIFYARPEGAVDVTDADLVLEGTSGDDFGASARSLPDSSGIDDLVVGAPGAGTTWILLGTGM